MGWPECPTGAQAHIGQSVAAGGPAHGAGSADFIVIYLDCAWADVSLQQRKAVAGGRLSEDGTPLHPLPARSR